MIREWQFCTAKLAKSANYAVVLFTPVMTNYAKNYASTIYQSLITHLLQKRQLRRLYMYSVQPNNYKYWNRLRF